MTKTGQKTARRNGEAARPEDVLKLAVNAFLAEQQKTLAIQIDDLTMAIKAASGSFEETGHDQAATVTRVTADDIHRWSSDMLKLDAEDLLGKVRESSERNPWLYVGGAALAGAVLAGYLNRIAHERPGG